MATERIRKVGPYASAVAICLFLHQAALTGEDAPMSSSSAVRAPLELGTVQWLRGFDEAAKLAEVRNKPLLILFDEVPGCGTCVNYGQQVLSHPLIVEAAETLFVPAAVYNNIKGADEQTLKSFKEPAWNNPVVRITTPGRTALAPRVVDDYTVGGLANAMTMALRKSMREVPTYLRLLAEESKARAGALERATFAMHCFWEGEAALGGIEGVYSTMPGFLHELEVVELQFDPEVVGYDKLVGQAKATECASKVFARTGPQRETAAALVGSGVVRTDEAIRPDKQPKYYLSNTQMKYVPMTSLQACRINSALGNKADPRRLLSPRQITLLRMTEQHPKAPWPVAVEAVDLVVAWKRAQDVVRSLK